jgi:bifunctional oligoribonuclease and PAP phosphatase NrnA
MPLTIETIRPIIEQKLSFIITTHVNPDGDGLGSEIALAHFLRKVGKTATIINHSKTPENYEWLDEKKEIIFFSPERDRDKILQADAIFIVDTNQPDRLRSMEPFVLQSPATKIVIDHHLDSQPFAHHYLLDENATSTGEIIYYILKTLNPTYIDKEIARSLYAAIMTDTGSFRYPRVDPEIHQIAAHLIELGADPIEAFSSVYENWPIGRMRLLGEVLDSMKTEYDGKLVHVVCTQKMFKETGTTEVETDNFTTYPMSVRGVQIGILFNELHNGVKISFRSKGNIPINELAKEFGGNGHLNAAGARLFDVKLQDIIDTVIKKAGKYLND